MPCGLRSLDQGFVRLRVVILIMIFFESGKAFRCGFLDLDSFFHGSGSLDPSDTMRAPSSGSGLRPDEIYLSYIFLEDAICPPFLSF